MIAVIVAGVSLDSDTGRGGERFDPDDVGAAELVIKLGASSVVLFLPLALLLFPDGRLQGGMRWRALVALLGVSAALFIVQVGTNPDGSPAAAGE